MSFRPDPSATAPGAPAPQRRNPIGIAALIVAIVMVVLGTVSTAVVYALPTLALRGNLGASEIGAVSAAFNLVVGLVAVVALVLGLVGISRPNAPRTASALALGAAVPAIIGLLVTLVLTLSFRFGS